MSTSGATPDRVGQKMEELRGDFVELASRTTTLAQAISGAGATYEAPFFVDGRLSRSASDLVAQGDTGSVLRRLIWVPQAAITGNNTNKFTLGIGRYNASGVLQGAVGDLGLLDFVTGFNGVAFVPIDFAGHGFTSGLFILPGEVLTYKLTQSGGTGLAPPAGLLVLEYARLSQ
jgi:hypothetical protein